MDKEEAISKENEKIIEDKKSKIISWVKKPENYLLLGVILFAFIIHLYYFLSVKNQPLWWDELCYGSLAKNFLSHNWDGTSIILGEMHIRPLLFPLIWAAILKIGFGEISARFLLSFLPSIVCIFFVYLIGKEIFNKRIGLISSLIFSIIWINIFYSSRFLVHMMELSFLSSSLYFFIIATNEKLNYKYFSFSLILLCLATLTRYQDGMIFFIYLIILILAKKLFLKDKKFWISGMLGISILLIFFLYNFIKYGNIFPALLSGGYISSPKNVPFAFNILLYIPNFLLTIFFILFLLGLGISMFNIYLSYNFLDQKKAERNSMLLILMALIFFSFFIFYLRGAEDRWLLEANIVLSIVSAIGFNFVYECLKKYNKIFSLVLITALLCIGAYQQIEYADSIINSRKDSFLQMKQGFEWIKQNSPKESIILGSGIEPYAVYYAERNYASLPSSEGFNLAQNKSDLEKIKADYLVVHRFTAQQPYIGEYLQNQDKWEPINAFFFDAEKKDLALIIYKAK